jgi:Domain of unknown function (DUF4864)
MRRVVLILVLLLAPLMVSAQENGGPESAIQEVIGNQFSAFSTGNLIIAWGYASPVIQGMFQTPENFGAMVERGFPMVWQPGEVTFQGIGRRNGRPVQRVQVIDADGRLHLLDYEMVQVDGNWRISAVEIVRAPSVGA